MPAEEAARPHPLPEYPYTAAFGVTRAVPVNTQMIAFENGQLNRHKNPRWASVRGTPMDAWRSGARRDPPRRAGPGQPLCPLDLRSLR